MKKGWRIVSIVVLVALLLGVVFVGVGYTTGANWERICSVLDAKYHFTEYIEYADQVWGVVMQEFF